MNEQLHQELYDKLKEECHDPTNLYRWILKRFGARNTRQEPIQPTPVVSEEELRINAHKGLEEEWTQIERIRFVDGFFACHEWLQSRPQANEVSRKYCTCNHPNSTNRICNRCKGIKPIKGYQPTQQNPEKGETK